MITAVELIRINHERLGQWGSELIRNNATPAILIGVGHDHHSGELHLCCPENLPKRAVLVYLAGALKLLSDQLKEGE